MYYGRPSPTDPTPRGMAWLGIAVLLSAAYGVYALLRVLFSFLS